MSGRPHIWLAWSMWGLTAALLVFVLVFGSMYPNPEGLAARIVGASILVLSTTSFSTVGALIAARHPRNAVGWIFCAGALLVLVAVFTADYAEYGIVINPGALPAARMAAWVQNWIWPLALCPVALFVLLFPDGRPPSPRWRPVTWIFVAALAAWCVSQALVPGRLVNADYGDATNPFGIEALGPVLRVLGPVSLLLILAATIASMASIVVRFRRSRGVEWRQIKWVAYAGAMMILVLLTQLAVEATVEQNEWLTEFLNLSLSAALISIPITAGIAILKHGLYDIDRIINRTLVYGLLTGSLAAIYLGSVVLFQTLFRSLTGEVPQLVIVASTLAIAALFNPLRRGIQSFIDRRFYRGKYDAAKTLEAFSARLRDEVDLDELSGDLVSVVEETIQPAHVSLWLRTPEEQG